MTHPHPTNLRRARRAVALAAIAATPVLLSTAAASAAGDANAAFGVSTAPGPTRSTTYAPLPLVTGTTGTRSRTSIFVADPAGDPRAQLASATVQISPTSATATATGVQLYAGSIASSRDLVADSLTASCAFDPATGAVSGTTTLAGGARTIAGTSTPLPATPAPGTTGTGNGSAYVLNRQTTGADGSLTVDAIVYTDQFGNVTTVGSVTCQPAELLAVPVASPLVGGLAAAGVAGAAGAIAVARSRRRRVLSVGT